MEIKIIVLGVWAFLTIWGTVDAVGFHGFHYKGLKEPEWVGPRTIQEKYVAQRVDHFNHRDYRTWNMRYYKNDDYFTGDGPILIMLGGEWKISPGFLQNGLMHDIGAKHGALLFYTEHRYYGLSRPTEDLSTENMQYLNVDQALADVAYFIQEQKSIHNIENATVIVFGGSYAGNMAAWARYKYPHLIQGAVASSAPVFAKEDFYEYLEVVTRSLERYDKDCKTEIKSAFDTTEELLASEDGPKILKQLFNLCHTPNVHSSNDVSFFMMYLAEIFGGKVQYNSGSGRHSTIGLLCKQMVNKDLTPLERLASLVRTNDPCNNVQYQAYIEQMRSIYWADSTMRSWFFQTCTEYGYYQTSNSTNSVFGTLFNLDFYVNICSDVYGKYYEKKLLDAGVFRTNTMYGGRFPDVTNVIFANGDVDPWHALSVLEDLNESSPAILIPGTSHCQDLYSDQSTDPAELIEARQRIREIVDKWLQK